jgi:hypothetical protein
MGVSSLFFLVYLSFSYSARGLLTRSLATIPDISHDVYPFKGMKLNHADVEHPALLRKVR